jgi:transcriptional regulator with PAS, ATPase and Fis domain
MAESLDDFKRMRLVKALKQNAGNRTMAADQLNVSVRTIRNWVKRYSLENTFPPKRGRRPL